MNVAIRRVFALAVLPFLILSAGCSGRNPTELDVARARIDPVVFDDDFGSDVYFQPFFQTVTEAATVDSVHAFGGLVFDGARSLKISVPPAGSSLGIFAGGVLTSGASRDLADFDALTFYARSDVEVRLDVAGFGNDNTGTSLYEAGRGGIPLTRDWTFFIVPIPNAAKLISERGMFTFAESTEPAHPGGYAIYLDEIRFAKLDNFEVFRPTLPAVNRGYFIGSTVLAEGTYTLFNVDGGFVRVDHSPNYFDFASDNNAVATVTPSGKVKVVGPGAAKVTAKLEDEEAFGAINVTGYLPPTVAAPAPTVPAQDVISLFSDVYDDVPVDTWRTEWSRAQFEEYTIAGQGAKLYSALVFVGIEFVTSLVDASPPMGFLHLDVYAPAGSNFKVKLVSFPASLGGGGVETAELVLDADTTPAFNSGGWSSLDIPLTDFQIPETNAQGQPQNPDDWDLSSLGQLILSTSSAQLALVDNVYWHK